MPMYDVIAIGDTTIDVFLELKEATLACDINKEDCMLQIHYADKIPVEKKTRIVAVGNAANNAIGSARLGLKSALVTIVGNDSDGKECRDIILSEGVNPEYIEEDQERGTNFSTVINYQAERTILVYHEQREYALPELKNTKWIYFTSMGEGSEVLIEPLLKHKKKTGAKLGFNPGTYQLKLPKETMATILKEVDVLILNKEEGERIVGKQGSIKQLLSALHKTGAKTIYVTDGRDGSYAYDGVQYWQCEMLDDAPAVERTGAGDSYSTGTLAALIHGKTMKEAMEWGTMNGSSVVQYIGAREGLLTQEGMQRLREQYPSFGAKNITND